MADHSTMKLGKGPAKFDKRTLKLATYLSTALAAAPASVDWFHGVTEFGMMLNNSLGCCTIAAVGHAVQIWTANALGRELTVPDATILKYYEDWDGYNPSDPNSDQGGVELDVLNNFRQSGFDGNKLDAYAAVKVGELENVKQGLYLFGGLYIGVELPITAQNQDVWDVPATLTPNDDPGSWGGHAIYLGGYDSTGPECITWGARKKMTWAWFEKYCTEAYALISEDWIETTNLAPSGIDRYGLATDLKIVSA